MALEVLLRDRVREACTAGFAEELARIMLDRHGLDVEALSVDGSLSVARSDGGVFTFEQVNTISLFEAGFMAALRRVTHLR